MNRYAHAIFCDDIRHEDGGKLTLVGVYRNQMLLQAVPVILPRLCAVVDVVTPLARPFRKLVLEVTLGDLQIARAEIASDELERLQATGLRPVDPAERDPRFTFSANFVFSPLRIERTGMLGVRVDIGEEELRANALRVVATTDPALPMASSLRH
ncbi:DUF6941 family protein [Dokdonella sp.]|uniref:DUF6941 family protein n=1 Tax=Dokdonella sp. TaxID=2291710 RepID=UPI0031C93C16|nr:hypothetical protein [Dokdonella sp.]